MGVLLIVLGIFVAQYLIRYGSHGADKECVAIVAAHKFMGKPLRQFILSIPTVKSCAFTGSADLSYLKDEAYVCARIEFAETNMVELKFYLWRRDVYPASPRTQYFFDRLATLATSGSVPSMATLLHDVPANDTLCSPEVLNAVALK